MVHDELHHRSFDPTHQGWVVLNGAPGRLTPYHMMTMSAINWMPLLFLTPGPSGGDRKTSDQPLPYCFKCRGHGTGIRNSSRKVKAINHAPYYVMPGCRQPSQPYCLSRRGDGGLRISARYSDTMNKQAAGVQVLLLDPSPSLLDGEGEQLLWDAAKNFFW